MTKLNKTSTVLIVVILIIVVAVGYMIFNNSGGNQSSNSAGQSASQPVTSQSGLQIQDEVMGTGTVAVAGNMVTVNYTGMLTDGKVFDSNIDPKFNHVQPFPFVLGAGQVIQGWDEGVAGMKVGGKRKLTIPPELGYGNQNAGNGLIPPNSTLIFEVELLNVKNVN